jgi:hypothetical protein
MAASKVKELQAENERLDKQVRVARKALFNIGQIDPLTFPSALGKPKVTKAFVKAQRLADKGLIEMTEAGEVHAS